MLPVILWKYLKLLQIPNQQTNTPILANQYLFVLGVLIGQCKLKTSIIEHL